MATNTERLDAIEAKLAELTERIALLERFSPHVEAARKDRERAARVAKARAVATVDEFKALAHAERAAFSERATADQLVTMLRNASSDDRKLVLEAAPSNAATVATFALAEAPHVVEVTSTVSLRTHALEIDARDVPRLAKLGLPATTLLSGTSRLAPFVLDRETPRYFDAAAFDELLALDEELLGYVNAGKVRVRKLDAAEAREQALRMFTERVNYARDLQRSDLMPSLPAL